MGSTTYVAISMRPVLTRTGLVAAIIALASPAQAAHSQNAPVDSIRAELERLYELNTAAFMQWDFAAVMALRAPDFHSITPDGTVRDRAAMENYIQGIMNGIKKWNSISIKIDSLVVVGDTAFAIVTQRAGS